MGGAVCELAHQAATNPPEPGRPRLPAVCLVSLSCTNDIMLLSSLSDLWLWT